MFKNVLHGTFWSGLAMLANTLITVIVFLILAVQLGPRAIGLVSMSLVFVAFANRLTSDEIADGLLRKDTIDELDKHSMFWLGVAIGAAASMLIYALAEPVARLFGEPEIAPLVRVLATIPLLNSLSTVARALLRREFAFRSLAYNVLTANILAGAIAIVMAATGAGEWSVVAFYVLIAASSALLFFSRGIYRPALRCSSERVRPLLRTAFLMGNARILAFIEEHTPRFLLGLVAGASALGLFMMAWNINIGLRRAIWTTLTHVLATASAEIKRAGEAGGSQRMLTAVKRSIEVPGILSLPMYLGFAAIAPEFFATYFKPDWAGTGAVARNLCLGFAFSILYMVPLELLRGSGKSRLLLAAWGASALSVVLITALLVRHGVVVTAAGLSLHFVLMTGVSLHLLQRGLGVDIKAPIIMWLRIAAAAALMALGVHYALHATSLRLPSTLAIPAVVLLGALVYPLLLWLLARPATDALVDLARRALRR